MSFHVVLVCLVSGAWLNAQPTDVRGEVVANSGAVPNQLTAEIYDPASHRIVERSPVSATGGFVLHNAPRGGTGYEVRIVDRQGGVLRQEHISGPMPGNLTIRVKGEGAERPSGEVVSVGRLRHKPSRRARKEYEKAEKASRQGDAEASLRHLREATRLDPEYLEAFNNLGTRLLNLGRPAEAADAFRKAAALDPAESKPYTNLAIALLHLNQPEEAERAARGALRLHRESRHAEYVLGLSLATTRRNIPEALTLLRSASNEWPHARLVAAHLLTRTGRLEEARRELALVLESGAPQHQATARQWMERIAAATRK
jgi:tetratricopeptide (TPR) repeat protein